MYNYKEIPKTQLQQVISSNLRTSLSDTLNAVQYNLTNEQIYITNQTVIDELGLMLSDIDLMHELAESRSMNDSDFIATYFNEVNPIPIEIPFANQTPLLTDVFIGNIANGIHLECDVYLAQMNERIAETQLKVRYYDNGVEDVTKVRSCSLIADDGGGLLFPNPLYGQEGQPQYVGDYTLAMILIDNGIKTFKEVVILMIRVSLQRIITKCGYA